MRLTIYLSPYQHAKLTIVWHEIGSSKLKFLLFIGTDGTALFSTTVSILGDFVPCPVDKSTCYVKMMK